MFGDDPKTLRKMRNKPAKPEPVMGVSAGCSRNQHARAGPYPLRRNKPRGECEQPVGHLEDHTKTPKFAGAIARAGVDPRWPAPTRYREVSPVWRNRILASTYRDGGCAPCACPR